MHLCTSSIHFTIYVLTYILPICIHTFCYLCCYILPFVHSRFAICKFVTSVLWCAQNVWDKGEDWGGARGWVDGEWGRWGEESGWLWGETEAYCRPTQEVWVEPWDQVRLLDCLTQARGCRFVLLVCSRIFVAALGKCGEKLYLNVNVNRNVLQSVVHLSNIIPVICCVTWC